MRILPTVITNETSNEVIETQLRQLIVGFDALSSLARSGQFSQDDDLRRLAHELPADQIHHLKSIFTALRNYGISGQINICSLTEDSQMDAIPVVLSGFVVAEVFSLDQPLALASILNAVVARTKLNTANGHPEPAFGNPYPDFFEAGRIPGVTVYELALLANMTETAVRNSVGQDSTINFVRNPQKPAYLEFQDADRWLKGRREFRPTYEAAEINSDEVSVPQASDDTLFDQSCKRRQGYQIGPKGSEYYVESYEQALLELKAMHTPRWRRPSKKTGRFGIVNGISWVTKTRKELGLE